MESLDVDNVSHTAEYPDEMKGEIIAALLDRDEYPANVNNVAAVSDQQIFFVRKDTHELVNFRFEFFDMADCRAIEYEDRPVYYRVALAIAFFIGTVIAVYLLATGSTGASSDPTPIIVAIVATLTIGIRFITSTHRHVIDFEMPDETLTWRSPATDYKYKADAAKAVCEFARSRGLLREKNQ